MKTTKQFIKEAIKLNRDRYDYSLVNYINSKTKIKIICKEHGEFEQRPDHHLNNHGCSKCSKNKKLTLIEFITHSNTIHNNKYDYSMVNYINAHTIIDIRCPIHGIFKQYPYNHTLNSNGCPDCAIEKSRLTKSIFIEKSNYIHNNKYDYSLVEYLDNKSKIKILCPIHGEFIQSPLKHLDNHGCSKCNDSKGEKEIIKIMDNKKILFETQKKFKGCEYKSLLKFDFYLPDYNICIEFDGKQHYQITNYWGGEKEFNDIKLRDKIKTDYCINNGIKLIRIKFNENIEEKLNFILNI